MVARLAGGQKAVSSNLTAPTCRNAEKQYIHDLSNRFDESAGQLR